MAAEEERKDQAEAKAKAKPKKAPKDCRCECGGQTKGGDFLPGHDAKLKSRHLEVLRDPSQKPEDRQAAKDALLAFRTETGKDGWLRPEDEGIDVSSKEKPAHLKAKTRKRAKASDSDSPPETNVANGDAPAPSDATETAQPEAPQPKAKAGKK